MDGIRFGSASITTVLEMELVGRPIGWLGAPADLIEANRWWLEPHFLEAGDTWSLNFRSWVVHVDNLVIVIDPCTGNSRPHPMSTFDMLDTPFLERFEETGYRVQDVDYVFCTHLHHDHCGWNTLLQDGRWVPTFPNARYLFVRREYDRWHPSNAARYRAVDYNSGVFERSIEPVVQAGQAELVLDRHRISPGLAIEPGHGHTAGHSMLRLDGGEGEAVFAGDAIHHPLQLIDPTVVFGDHDDRVSMIETRRRLALDSLERSTVIIPAHLPFPHAGRLRKETRGIRFAPWLEPGDGAA